jgi:hypothetical protein
MKHRPTRRRSCRLIVAAGIACAVVGSTASAQAAASPVRTTTLDASQLSVAVNALDVRGMTAYGETYGGLALTDAGTRAIVYLTRRDRRTETALAGSIPVKQLAFEVTARTARQQQQLHDRVAADWAAVQHDGKMLLYSAGANPATGKEVVKVVNLTPADRRFLLRRFGPDVEVLSARRSDIPVATSSRISDSAPWNGGDFISVATGGCTSGIPTHNAAGQQFMVTAGHCFAAGATTYNWASPIGLGSATSTTKFGTVFSRDLRPGHLDAEIIATAASSLTWVGGSITSTSRSFQGGAGPTQAGSHVCLSGAYDGEHCGLVVQAGQSNVCLNISYTFGVQQSCHLSVAVGTDEQSVGPGDSGGPVYQYFGTTPKAVGIVTAGSSQAVCKDWDAQWVHSHGGQHRYCSNRLIFTNIANILQQWSLTVNG